MATAVAPSPAPAAPQAPAVPPAPDASRLYRLSVAQYERMIDQGVLKKHDRIELIEGLLVKKMTKNSPHITATLMTQEALGAVVPTGWLLAHEIPVLLARSEPEPDFMVMRGRARDYHGRKPIPRDVGLLVEVADSSLDDDRARVPLFAEAGVPIYWIVNIPERKVEVFSNPLGTTYQSRQDHGEEAEIPVLLDGQPIARLKVRDLLPPAEAS